MSTQVKELTILSKSMAVGPFLTTKTLRLIKTLGYASIINTMPNARSAIEDIGIKAVAKRARDCGMEYRNMPADNISAIDAGTILEFQDALAELQKPVFVFSRTGLRATALWAEAMADTMRWEDILGAVVRAGHDVSLLTNYSIPPDRKAA